MGVILTPPGVDAPPAVPEQSGGENPFIALLMNPDTGAINATGALGLELMRDLLFKRARQLAQVGDITVLDHAPEGHENEVYVKVLFNRTAANRPFSVEMFVPEGMACEAVDLEAFVDYMTKKTAKFFDAQQDVQEFQARMNQVQAAPAAGMPAGFSILGNGTNHHSRRRKR